MKNKVLRNISLVLSLLFLLSNVACASTFSERHEEETSTDITEATQEKADKEASSPSSSKTSETGLEPPLYFAYFRTWHDKATDKNMPNSIQDVPKEVDVVFVFPAGTPADSDFWPSLKNEYIPKLHKQGTKVVYSQGIHCFYDERFEDNPEGHKARAKHYLDFLEEYNLDGIDIDMEADLSAEEEHQATAVISELAKSIGPSSNSDKLFIYDTNRNAGESIFMNNYQHFNYILLQAYGREVSSLGVTWLSYSKYIKPEQFLIGFSFYEERDQNLWDDTSEPFEESRAYQYANWQPPQGKKAGIFAYAVDRDWTALGDDEIKLASYKWSKALKKLMLENYKD